MANLATVFKEYQGGSWADPDHISSSKDRTRVKLEEEKKARGWLLLYSLFGFHCHPINFLSQSRCWRKMGKSNYLGGPGPRASCRGNPGTSIYRDFDHWSTVASECWFSCRRCHRDAVRLKTTDRFNTLCRATQRTVADWKVYLWNFEKIFCKKKKSMYS